MAQPLSDYEETILGHLRRLLRDCKDFKLEIFGGFSNQRRELRVRVSRDQQFVLKNCSEWEFDKVD